MESDGFYVIMKVGYRKEVILGIFLLLSILFYYDFNTFKKFINRIKLIYVMLYEIFVVAWNFTCSRLEIRMQSRFRVNVQCFVFASEKKNIWQKNKDT